jgi:hypothetical protein
MHDGNTGSSALRRIATAIAVLVVATLGGQGQALPPDSGAVHDFKDVTISMQRTACYGACPVYSIEISGDGSATYKGEKHVADAGPHTVQLRRSEVVRLLTAFLSVRFFELLDEYREFDTVVPRGDDKFSIVRSTETCGSTTILNLRIADRKKTVALYEGYPSEIGELVKLIDGVVGTEAWVRGASK